MSFQPYTTRDDFDYWVFEMDDALEHFLSHFSPKTRVKLDYTAASLTILESWIMETYSSTEAMLEQKEVQRVDGAARYLGETYRKVLGGYWDIRLEDPEYVFYGLPILTGFAEHMDSECPFSLITASADRRTGYYLRTVLQYYMDR